MTDVYIIRLEAMYNWSDKDVRERSLYVRGYNKNHPKVEGSGESNIYKKYTYSSGTEELKEKLVMVNMK